MLLYYTKDIHKLIESTARVCYQSYDKLNEDSHKMLRGIMGKGHLSVASVGNMVFTIKTQSQIEYMGYMFDLVKLKEITNYIRWTTPSNQNESKYDIVISMNVLCLMDIVKHFENTPNYYYNDLFFVHILPEAKRIDEIKWFLDDTFKLEGSENTYCVTPTLNNPILLTEDYSELKKNLTPYELMNHATVTLDLITDRATGLQMWRHADQVGGCELSQRYVDRSNANLRLPEGLSEEDQAYMESLYVDVIGMYNDLKHIHGEKGKKRSTEIARGILPNNMTTRIIQCRPLRQWKHFFDLRRTPHAQLEIQADAEQLYKLFKEKGITDLFN